MKNKQVGIISCSGEECLGGTISRLATRKVLERLRINKTVTLCLPLYIAGGKEEREFAKEYPVIAIDGCNKCCAKKATLKYSGKVEDTVVLSDLIGEEVALSKTVSIRDLDESHTEMVTRVAQEICKKVDRFLEK